MTLDVSIDPDTFGLGIFWNAPLGGDTHEALASHRITIILLHVVIGIEWRR